MPFSSSVTHIKNAAFISSVFLFLVASNALAYLPAGPANTGGAQSDDMFSMGSFMIKKGLTLAVYVVGGAAFIAVIWNVVQKVIEWRQGRSEFGDVLQQAGVGAGLLVLVGVVLTVALKIIDSITV